MKIPPLDLKNLPSFAKTLGLQGINYKEILFKLIDTTVVLHNHLSI